MATPDPWEGGDGQGWAPALFKTSFGAPPAEGLSFRALCNLPLKLDFFFFP